MYIDGKANVKKRIKIFESDYFTTYLYEFENGNQYKDTVSKWKQKDFTHKVPRYSIEDRMEKLNYIF